MKLPKIYYENSSIEFKTSEDFIPFHLQKFQDFLQNPKGRFQIFVKGQKQYHAIWKEMLKILTPIEAAGGLIQNSKGEVLMIFRRGKWDLPKGKIDDGEAPEETALREIEEEVGIPKQLQQLQKFIGFTYHIYHSNGKLMLKTTYWYDILVTEPVELVPQTKEDIEEAIWLDKDEALEKEIYASIAEVLHRTKETTL